MKTSILALAAFAAVVGALISFGYSPSGSAALAQEPALPGMCNGRTDANIVLTAHANGNSSEVPKYILNLSTDDSGHPTGTLVLGRGKDRLQITDWCRLWQHLPSQPYPDQCSGDIPEGATTAHAVGTGTYMGEPVLVRTDVRGTDEGLFFRVRWRVMGDHDREVEAAEHDDGGCEDETWNRVPEEGWAPLSQLKVKAIEP